MAIFPRLNESLCGCSLETGSKIIGWFSVTAHIFLFIINWIQCINMEDGIDFAEKEEVLFHMIAKEMVLSLYIVFDVLLIMGVYNKRPSFIFAWMAAVILTITIALIYNIILFIRSLEYAVVIQGSIYSVATYYCLIIVNGHYEDLKSGGPGVY